MRARWVLCRVSGGLSQPLNATDILKQILLCNRGGCRRMCASIASFSTFSISHLSPDVTTRNVSRRDQCSPGGQAASLVYANSGEKSLSQMPAAFSGAENSCSCGGRIPQQGQDLPAVKRVLPGL